MPLFVSLSEVFPQANALVVACRDNIKQWNDYQETPQDRLSYEKR